MRPHHRSWGSAEEVGCPRRTFVNAVRLPPSVVQGVRVASPQNDVIKRALSESGVVGLIASEEEDEPVVLNDHGRLVVVFDPLDGSRNIDASIPTG